MHTILLPDRMEKKREVGSLGATLDKIAPKVNGKLSFPVQCGRLATTILSTIKSAAQCLLLGFAPCRSVPNADHKPVVDAD